MSKAIRIGILGYGNIGRGVELALRQNPDMKLEAVFTRRSPDSVSLLTKGVKVVNINDVESYKDAIDVMILCGGSATDLPNRGAISLLSLIV
jgi:diaminopimelate dehydrogenase